MIPMEVRTNEPRLPSAGVEERLTKLESKMQDEIKRRQAALKAVAKFKQSEDVDEEEALEEGPCWIIVKILQYIIGFILSSYSLFITFYGLASGYSKSSPCDDNQRRYETDYAPCEDGPFHPVLVIFFLCLLLTVLAFCEGTQIALMLLEKVRRQDISDDMCCSARVKRTHEIAQNNPERYLLGRQIFVTGIVFFIAKMIGMKYLFAKAVEAELGWFGNKTLVSIFVDTGFAGSLIVLAFGQLLPQLIVTTIPILQYQLFPTYEIIWIQLFCERLGVAEMAPILRKFTRYVFNLKDEDFGVGSGVEFKVSDEENQDAHELSCCTSFWMDVPFWQQVIKVFIGLGVFFLSIYLILENIISGKSDFTKVVRDANGAPVIDMSLPYPHWTPLESGGDVSIWIQLLVFLPLSNILMGYLEGSQIAILALEKAPAKLVKRVHREAYFGHKLTQQRDNVRRYLLGRQFLVVFVDFIAAHSMGLGGLGILVPVSQLYPQLLAATNPMWFMGTWGSKAVLIITLVLEFTGLCHFSWGLFSIFFFVRKMVIGDDEKADVGSVGQVVNIEGAEAKVDDAVVDDITELQQIVLEQQQKIVLLEKTLADAQ